MLLYFSFILYDKKLFLLDPFKLNSLIVNIKLNGYNIK